MRFGSREGSYLLSKMLARSLPAVSGAMAIEAFVVETAHQMAYRPRLRGTFVFVSASRTGKSRASLEAWLAREPRWRGGPSNE